MSSNTAKRSCAGALMISAFLLSSSAIAQQAAPQVAPKPVAKDTYQRSLQTYEVRKSAQSGPEHGREIFYYKCWFCHNQYTKNAPQLTGLYQRGTLLSGLPVNDDNVKDRIRNAGTRVDGYKNTPTEADFNHLVRFLGERGRWGSKHPPPTT